MVFQLPIAASKPHQNLVAWNNHHLIISVIVVDRECEQDSAGWFLYSMQHWLWASWYSVNGWTDLRVQCGLYSPAWQLGQDAWKLISPGPSASSCGRRASPWDFSTRVIRFFTRRLTVARNQGESCWSYWKLGIMHWLVKNGYRQLVFKRRKIVTVNGRRLKESVPIFNPPQMAYTSTVCCSFVCLIHPRLHFQCILVFFCQNLKHLGNGLPHFYLLVLHALHVKNDTT